MNHIRPFAAVLLTALVLTLLPSAAARAYGDETPGEWGILQPADMASYGETTVSTPVMDADLSQYPDLLGMKGGLTTAISVVSPRPGDYSALIINDSIAFLSTDAARSFIQGKIEEVKQSSRSDGVEPVSLDVTLQRTILENGVEVYAVRQVDSDGLAVFDILLQKEAFVAGIRVMVFASTLRADTDEGSIEHAQKIYTDRVTQAFSKGATMLDIADLDRGLAVGAELTEHAIGALLARSGVTAPIVNGPAGFDENRPALTGPDTEVGASPDWYGTSSASFWRHMTAQGESCGALNPDENCHHLATWTRPYGNGPHFVGSGGDAATCNSNHGCISQWTWWLLTPESRLGVPKSFYFPYVLSGSMVASNYTASVWYD